jgi:uncharacterized membrane protein
MNRYHINSPMAIIGGLVCVGCSVTLVTRDAAVTGLTADHVLMFAMVLVAILSAHLSLSALKQAKIISALGLALVAALSSSVMIYETMKRRADTRETVRSERIHTVEQYAAIAADYQRATKLTAEAATWQASECATGKGKKCDGVTYVYNQRLSHQKALKAELEGMKAPPPVDAGLDVISGLAAWFGYDKAATSSAIRTIEPFALPILFEIGAVFFFGYGFGQRRVSVPVSVSVPAETPKALSFEGPYTDQEIEELTRILNGMGQPLTNDEVAAALRISKSEASKRVQKAVEAGKVVKLKTGRFNQISLVA